MAYAANGTNVGITANSTDPDTGDTVTYQFTSNPNNLFAINANTGVVTVASSANLNPGTYTIGVDAVDNHGLAGSSTNFTLNVESVAFTIDAANLGTLDTGSNLKQTTSMGTFTFTGDPDTSDVYTYALGGADANLFTLNTSTGQLSTGGANVSGGATYHITITATDSDEPAIQVAVPVTIVAGTTGGDTLPLGTGINMAYGLNEPTPSRAIPASMRSQGERATTSSSEPEEVIFLMEELVTDTFKYNAITYFQPGIANNVANYDTIADFNGSGTDREYLRNHRYHRRSGCAGEFGYSGSCA